MDKSTKSGFSPKSQDLPEAPASVTARVVSDQGFHLLFTLRDTTVSGLINKFDEFQKHVLTRGWKPETLGKDVQNGSRKKNEPFKGWQNPVVAHQTTVPRTKSSSPTTCEVCGSPAIKKTGNRKDGTVWEGVFCSTGEQSHTVWLS